MKEEEEEEEEEEIIKNQCLDELYRKMHNSSQSTSFLEYADSNKECHGLRLLNRIHNPYSIF